MKKTTLFLLLLLFSGCSDNATVIKTDPNLNHLACLKLTVFPPDAMISNTLKRLYHFTPTCSYELQVSKKSGITCNSNQNADTKALSNFPNGYIRIDIYKNRKVVYSYYRDLTTPVSKKIVTQAFQRVQKDLLEKESKK
jgi:hypothetical protein